MPSHTAKGRVIQKGVVCDDGDDAFFLPFDFAFGKADEFDIVIL